MKLSGLVLIALGLFALHAPVKADSARSDVRFSNGGVELAGTVVAPTEGGPFPGLVMVHGSGAGERSELLDVAQRLAAGGLAVLIYDKRGSGQSGGNWVRSSLTDLAADAAAGYRFLVDQPQVDAGRSGFWGISQGGWIVPLAAGEVSPAFAIVVTGGGLTPKQVETASYRQMVQHADSSPQAAEAADVLIQAYFDYLANVRSYESLMSVVEQSKGKAWHRAMGIEHVIPKPDNRSNWEWVATFDPRDAIRQLDIPVLVLLGAKDTLSPACETARVWREALAASSARNAVIVFQDAGHGMRTGGHGGDFVPAYFTTQFDWLRAIGVLRTGPGQTGQPFDKFLNPRGF